MQEEERCKIGSIDAVIDVLCNPRYAFAFLCFRLALPLAYMPIQERLNLAAIQNSITVWCAWVVLYSLFDLISRTHIEWRDQIAIVTGSNGGLGKAIVSQLQAKGCRIVCVDVNQDDSTNETQEILHIVADVGNADQIRKIPTQIRAKYGRDATILISNAGVMVGKKILDFEDGQFERTISVNFLATYHLVKAILPSMLSSGHGHIAATCSVMGYISISQLTDYVASKHALVGFMESLRFELDKKYKSPNIHTTTLILGKLSTPLFARTTISPISRFFTPIQNPELVAKALVDQIDRGKGGKIYLPYLARLAPILKAMPDCIRNAVQWASGADDSLHVVVDKD